MVAEDGQQALCASQRVVDHSRWRRKQWQPLPFVEGRAAELGGAPAGKTLTFTIEQQRQNQWCWAAVTASIAAFFDVAAASIAGRLDAGLTVAVLSEGDPFFYEPVLDTLVKADGSTTLTLEALALREFDLGGGRKFLLGPVYDLTTVREAPENRKQDIGLIAAWSKSRRARRMRGTFRSATRCSLATSAAHTPSPTSR